MIENLTSQPAAAKKTGKSNRGFASMNPERHKEISSRGGKSSRRPASSDRNRMNPTETAMLQN